MQVYVQDLFGQVFTLDVEPSDTIENVKQQVTLATGGLPGSRQALGFGGNANLQDGRSLADYNIQKESTLWLTLIPLSEHFEGPLGWSGGESVTVEFTDQNGFPEASLHSLAGTLDLSAVTAHAPVLVHLVSLYRAMNTFDSASNYSWTILEWDAGEVIGFAPEKFSILTDGFDQSFDGAFSVTLGDGLVLSYTAAIPEPASAALVVAGLVAAGVACRRRRPAGRGSR